MLKKPKTNKKYFPALIVGNDSSIINKGSETRGNIKRNHYFQTACIICPDSLLLSICRLQLSSVQLPTAAFRCSQQASPVKCRQRTSRLSDTNRKRKPNNKSEGEKRLQKLLLQYSPTAPKTGR